VEHQSRNGENAVAHMGKKLQLGEKGHKPAHIKKKKAKGDGERGELGKETCETAAERSINTARR